MHLLVRSFSVLAWVGLLCGPAMPGFNSSGSFGDAAGYPPTAAAGGVATTYMAAPVMIAYPGNLGTRSATTYYAMTRSAPNVLAVTATEAQVETPLPSPVSVTGLQVTASTAIAAGSWAVTVRQDTGSGPGNTTVTCTLTGGATSCTDYFGTTGHSATFNAGDKIDVAAVDSSGTAAYLQISFLMRSTAGQDAPLFFGTAASVTLAGATVPFTNGQLGTLVVPAAGHIDDLYFYVSSAPGTGSTDTVTALHGACGTETVTSLVASATGTGTVNQQGSDVTPGHGFDVAAGDCIGFQIAGTGTGSAAAFVQASVRWSPGLSGTNYNYPIMGVGTTLPATATGKWCAEGNQALCYGGGGFWFLPDMTTSLDTRVATAKSIYAVTTNTGGTSGQTRQWSLVAGNGTSGNPTCTIPATGTSICGTSGGTATMAIGTAYGMYNILGGSGNAVTGWKAGVVVGIQ